MRRDLSFLRQIAAFEIVAGIAIAALAIVLLVW